MSKSRRFLMIAALALVVGFGTNCFPFKDTKSKLVKKAEIPECASLSGQAKIDCEAQHKNL